MGFRGFLGYRASGFLGLGCFGPRPICKHNARMMGSKKKKAGALGGAAPLPPFANTMLNTRMIGSRHNARR